jgi:hypothetical protein
MQNKQFFSIQIDLSFIKAINYLVKAIKNKLPKINNKYKFGGKNIKANKKKSFSNICNLLAFKMCLS